MNLTRVWGRKGERKQVNKSCGFKSSNIYGAICPELGIGEAFIINELSKEAQQKIIKQISNTNKEAIHRILLDRAPWHKNLEVPENIRLVFLPPYSPELNPMERVWQEMKQKYLSNIIFHTLEEIEKALASAWERTIANIEFIKSFYSDAWPCFG